MLLVFSSEVLYSQYVLTTGCLVSLSLAREEKRKRPTPTSASTPGSTRRIKDLTGMFIDFPSHRWPPFLQGKTLLLLCLTREDCGPPGRKFGLKLFEECTFIITSKHTGYGRTDREGHAYETYTGETTGDDSKPATFWRHLAITPESLCSMPGALARGVDLCLPANPILKKNILCINWKQYLSTITNTRTRRTAQSEPQPTNREKSPMRN
ncbi:uncharacterized protein BO95DRAFT_239555 [Aspergillus brunneoviolaceus CBS 621.78]|uniref:Uncharacterized protein n=1 Tax=Aspergillus brunneoviolaceus CBS 621.78 TaxID=1450534 RepID=A0ACD1FZ48_9EURO|nr:hypothetical protein BO95DRAFT_239555 [Aspergillus brunneoviolaceus CBS 621.78]RAH42250.1 hypothetical protein BO95DRAFT_239555 [Aspergillus brunneoviolaceus CBS 621.78]